MEIENGQTHPQEKTTSFWSVLTSLFNRPVFGAFVVTVLAVAVRINLISRDYPLSFDDGVYALSIDHVTNGDTPFKEVFSSQGGYFLSLISIPAQIFGDSFWSFRLVPALAGILTAVLVLFLARRFMSPGFALMAGIATALSGSLLRTTAPITSDGILVAMSVVCILLAYRFVERPHLMRAITLGLAIGLGCGIKSIFMIPTLIFVLVVTWKTSFLQRLLAAGIAVAVFALPFAFFGLSDTLDQSVFYHLDKGETLSIADNFSKITSTYASFDLALFALGIIATILAFAYAISTKFFSRTTKKDFFLRLRNTRHPLSLFACVLIPTYLLMLIQAPLFRNHLAIFIPVLAVYTFWALDKFAQTLGITWKRIFNAVVLLIVLVGSFISLGNLLNDSLIKRNTKFDAAVSIVSMIPEGTLILTNEPGVAWAAKRDVPLGLEDTSRYRFTSTRDGIQLNEATVRTYLKNDRVCAIVSSPEHNPPVIDWTQVAPSSWTIISVDRFTVWVNPAQQCTPLAR